MSVIRFHRQIALTGYRVALVSSEADRQVKSTRVRHGSQMLWDVRSETAAVVCLWNYAVVVERLVEVGQ